MGTGRVMVWSNSRSGSGHADRAACATCCNMDEAPKLMHVPLSPYIQTTRYTESNTHKHCAEHTPVAASMPTHAHIDTRRPQALLPRGVMPLQHLKVESVHRQGVGTLYVFRGHHTSHTVQLPFLLPNTHTHTRTQERAPGQTNSTERSYAVAYERSVLFQQCTHSNARTHTHTPAAARRTHLQM